MAAKIVDVLAWLGTTPSRWSVLSPDWSIQKQRQLRGTCLKCSHLTGPANTPIRLDDSTNITMAGQHSHPRVQMLAWHSADGLKTSYAVKNDLDSWHKDNWVWLSHPAKFIGKPRCNRSHSRSHSESHKLAHTSYRQTLLVAWALIDGRVISLSQTHFFFFF